MKQQLKIEIEVSIEIENKFDTLQIFIIKNEKISFNIASLKSKVSLIQTFEFSSPFVTNLTWYRSQIQIKSPKTSFV